MENTKKLLKEFQSFWNISLNGDCRHGYELSSLAKAIAAEAAKPEFNKTSLSPTEQITLKHALILVFMENTKKLLKEFQSFWNISLDGDYRHGYKLSSLAKAIAAEAAKPEFNKTSLSLTEQITLQHALILVNIELS